MAWTVTCTLLYPPRSPNLRSSPLKTTQPLAPVTVSTPVPLPGTALKRATRPARSKLASVTAYLGIPETNASHLPGWSRDPNWEPLAAVRLPRPPSSSAGRRGAGKPRRGLWPRPPHPGPAILLVSAPGRPRPPPAPSLARVPAAPRAAERGSPSALQHHLLPGVGNERSPGLDRSPRAPAVPPGTAAASRARARPSVSPTTTTPTPGCPQGVTPAPLTRLTVPRRPASAAISRRGVSVPRAAARPDGGRADAARQPS